jgi:hypothetical protein
LQPSPHAPQSKLQVLHVSPLAASQVLSPQTEQLPQSLGQLLQVSPAPHWPLPQVGAHLPQSLGQVSHDSPAAQKKSPQLGHAPQSLAQTLHDSPGSQLLLPHTAGQLPQSLLQLLQSSLRLGSHLPSPHSEHWPQSLGQALQSSPGSHAPLPHRLGQPPQSLGQVWQLSPWLGLHTPSPHTLTLGHTASKSAQQSPACLHAWSQKQPSDAPPQLPTHEPGLHGPQSLGQVWQVSGAPSGPIAQLPSPQPNGGHFPQSLGQVEQLSPASQFLLPQTGLHGPQSPGQLEQLSPGSQILLPQPGLHGPQSAEQLLQLSLASQMPLPQGLGQAPQSAAQVRHDSPSLAEHTLLPQPCWHGQSLGQVSQLSPAWKAQMASPHLTTHSPQSSGQLEHVSLASHF